MSTPLVLASESRYRAQVLTTAGYMVVADAPDVDERAADHLLAVLGAEGLALELARRKADAVAPRHPGATVVAADQVGVVGSGSDALMLTKMGDVESAVQQLVAMSGTTHRLFNGVVVVDLAAGTTAEGVDVQEVTMRAFTEAEARRYVEHFEPFDSAGSYRLEDGERMDAGESLVAAVRGEHDSGVLGMPLPLLERLLAELQTTR